MSATRELPVRKTLNKKFDAYCRVCWNAVYVLWVDDEDPAGKCMRGHKHAHECEDAMSRAQLQAVLAKLRKDGVIK